MLHREAIHLIIRIQEILNMNIDILVINALLDSFMKVVANMAAIELKTGLRTGEPLQKQDTLAKGDISCVMPLNSAEIDGSIAISFSNAVIFDLAERMLGDDYDAENEDKIATALDLAGEITNMIVGGTKRVLSDHGFDIDMASPVLLYGKGHEIKHHTGGTTIILPFYLDSGEAFLELNFDRTTV